MKHVRLDKEAVKTAVTGAQSESDAVVAVFRQVYPNFDAITSVDGYPKCNEKTWKEICQWFMDLTGRLNRARRYDKQVMPGSIWMNYGFSANGSDCEALKDWHVLPAPVRYAEATATECVGAL
jgi:hypothetical protein